MATQAYYAWDRAGRPWKVAAPMKAIGDRLKAHGYIVYYLGSDDASHLQASYPEDHCPFSVTGWPGKHPYPYVTAMDVMPPKSGQVSKLDGKPLPSLQQISAQMRADKIADHRAMRWLKYMNWEPQRNYGGDCWHDSWQPGYARRASSDRGHTHMSGRTDYVTSTASNGYDPVARVRGEDDDMGLDRTTPLYKGGPTERQALGDLVYAYFKGNTLSVEQQALTRIELTQKAVLAAVNGVNEEAVLAAVREEAKRLQEAVAAHAAKEAERDVALRALVEQAATGELDAAEVVRLIGERLAAPQG